MGRHILIPVDNSETAWNALDYAIEYYDGDQITVLYVVDPLEGDYHTEEDTGKPAKRSEQVGESVRARFEAAEIASSNFEFVTLKGRPAQEILAYTEDNEVDQIVMGSKGRTGMKRLLLGSVAEMVVRRSPVPVNIVR